MKKINILIALFASLAASSFAQSTKDTAVLAKTTVLKSDPLSEILKPFFDLKNALASDKGELAKTSAQALLTNIGRFETGKLTPAQHAVWMSYAEKLAYDAEHIKASRDVEHQREHFNKLSANEYALVKAFHTNTSVLYYQYCPMANNGKGAYWLSELEKISNPYMGRKMPSCGSTKETVPAN
jgi:hypothetical protein